MDKYKITANTWNKLASIYQDKFMDLDLYNGSYDLFCDYIKKQDANILEIGCGPGNITKYLVNIRPDFKVLATDVAPTMIDLARQNVPQAEFAVMDCRNIDQINRQFDALMCGFCLPYLSREDCFRLISNSQSLLSNNGILYLSCIEGDYQDSGFETGSTGDRTFVYYYTIDDLSEALYVNNFDMLEVIRKPFPMADGSEQTHLILLAKT